jgi:hypothetical protein
MPAKDRVRGDDGSNVHETPSTERLPSHRQSPALGIGQPKASATELLFEDAILLPQILDGGFLLTSNPPGHGGDEDLPRLKDSGHPSIVASGPGIGQLSWAERAVST